MEEECCVAGCINTEDNGEVLFHKFPRNSDLKGIWMNVIPLKPELSDVPIICSDHFPDTDYKDIKGKKIINRLAIPSIFKINTKDTESDNSNKESVIDKENELSDFNNENVGTKSENEITNSKNDKQEKTIEETKISSNKNDESQQDNKVNEQETESKSEDSSMLDTNCKDLDKNNKLEDNVHDRLKVTDKNNITEAESNNEVKEKENDFDLEDTIPSFVISDTQNPGDSQRIPRYSPIDYEVPIDVDASVVENVPECDIETLEVSIDPSSLMIDMPVAEIELSDGDSDIVPADPVSLLTSSDEEAVIYQPPNIDTVEVSDETDEEDRPLVKLLDKRPRLNGDTLNQMETKIITNIMKKVNEFICVICQFRTGKRSKFFEHVNLHSGLVQKCYTCNFKTGSLVMFKKHLINHTNEKRFQCHLCSFKAKHHMSLVYHLQDHVVYSCSKCEFRTFDSADLDKHKRGHESAGNVCIKCNKVYKTRVGLRRHLRKHYSDDELDDDDDDD